MNFRFIVVKTITMVSVVLYDKKRSRSNASFPAANFGFICTPADMNWDGGA
jgi:hypothetical protein